MTRSARISTASLVSRAMFSRVSEISSGLFEPLQSMGLGAGRPGPFHLMQAAYSYGDKTSGQDLLGGRFEFAGQSVDVGMHGNPWAISVPSPRYASWLHSFEWMDDLLSIGSKSKNKVAQKAAEVRARILVDSWTTHYGQWNSFSWDIEVLTPRLWKWLVHWSPVLSSDSAGEAASIRRSVVLRQAKYLRKRFKKIKNPLTRLKAAAVLALMGARLSEKSDAYLGRGLDWLDDEVEVQILPDGGHISRSPEATLEALDILLTLDTLLADRGVEGTRTISRAIDRLIPKVAFFLHSDGKLANFNGGGTSSPERIKAVLDTAPGEPKAFSYSPHSQYQRLSAGETILIMDTGTTPPLGFDSEAHLAPLAFELSTDIGRLVVNCGWNKPQSTGWRRPMRSSAAHSTLSLESLSPGQLLPKGWKTKLVGESVLFESGPAKAQQKEQPEGIWLESSHQGYLARTGLSHRRRIFMSHDGVDIRGEDTLFVPLGHTPLSREERDFDIRFHFHPDVRVSLSQDQSSALIIQKGQTGWRFRTDKTPLILEDSVYLAEGHKPIKCQQLVISGRALSDSDGEGLSNRARWSFRKLENRRKDG